MLTPAEYTKIKLRHIPKLKEVLEQPIRTKTRQDILLHGLRDAVVYDQENTPAAHWLGLHGAGLLRDWEKVKPTLRDFVAAFERDERKIIMSPGVMYETLAADEKHLHDLLHSLRTTRWYLDDSDRCITMYSKMSRDEFMDKAKELLGIDCTALFTWRQGHTMHFVED